MTISLLPLKLVKIWLYRIISTVLYLLSDWKARILRPKIHNTRILPKVGNMTLLPSPSKPGFYGVGLPGRVILCQPCFHLHLCFMYASSEGSGDTAHLHRLVWAFSSRRYDGYQNCWLKQSRSRSGSSYKSCWSGSTLFAYGNYMIIYDPTHLHKFTLQVISLFYMYVQTWKLNFDFIIIIHSGWSLPWIFMKERVKVCLYFTAQERQRHISLTN